MNQTGMLSFVVPLLNEESSLAPLHEAVARAVEPLSLDYEIIFVDDGSSDGSPAVLQDLHQQDPEHVRVIQFRRNFGKMAAMTAGFARARGEIIVTLDADLQDDPGELPKLLVKLDEGYDLVIAWRTNRSDPLSKRLPSKFANLMVSALTSVQIHDVNCGFKVYRREVLQDLKLYGELHRYIPVLAHWQGYRIAEVPVRHHPRRYGRSKYGIGRLGRSYIDFLSVLFLTSYLKRPMQLFGMLGSVFALLGVIIMFYLAVVWLIEGGIGWRPLLFFGTTALVVGIQLISVGLLGEMLRNITFRAEDEYSIRQVWDSADPAGKGSEEE
ncbi:MAG TPA: glycosyltransferase family 2 protein [Anaerolineae bacterium]|nr:glycosyltransferase family 2 protein [Anaerolineae bacterium]